MNEISCWIVRGSIAAVALLALPILAPVQEPAITDTITDATGGCCLVSP